MAGLNFETYGRGGGGTGRDGEETRFLGWSLCVSVWMNVSDIGNGRVWVWAWV